MNYFDLYPSYSDHSIAAAWDSQVQEADETPWFAEILRSRGTELFPHFAACYAELRALPRATRRALQREAARSIDFMRIFSAWHPLGGGQALQHKLAGSLAGAALLLALWQGVSPAATINVTTKDPSIRPDGKCSLIEAIVNANADAAFFADCPAGSGPDTIVLPVKGNLGVRNQYADAYGPTGLPLITSQITIQGNGAKIHRQGGPAFRLITVSQTGDLTLQDVEIGNGRSSNGAGILNKGTLTVQNSTISGNSSQIGGGVANYGSLSIENSTITKNSAGSGGGVSNGGFGSLYSPSSVGSLRPGAACFNYYWYFYGSYVYCRYAYSGALTISNSTISKNSGGSGGGVLNIAGTIAINGSTISGNNGFNNAGDGAGVFNSGGLLDVYGKYFPAADMTIATSTISKNSGGQGGGIFNEGIITIENSTISANKASDDGGGLFNSSNTNAPAGTMNLIDNTITENRAKDSGGGLFNEGSLNLTNSTISGNKARFGADVFP